MPINGALWYTTNVSLQIEHTVLLFFHAGAVLVSKNGKEDFSLKNTYEDLEVWKDVPIQTILFKSWCIKYCMCDWIPEIISPSQIRIYKIRQIEFICVT